MTTSASAATEPTAIRTNRAGETGPRRRCGRRHRSVTPLPASTRPTAWSASPAPANVASRTVRFSCRKRDQEPSGGLGVVGERLELGRRCARDVGARELAVPAVAARPDPGCGELERAGKRRQRVCVEDDPDAGAKRRLVGVAEQPEAGHVGDRVRRERPQRVGRVAVQLAHGGDRGLERAVRRASLAHRLEDEAGAERLRQQDGIAGLCAALPPHPVGVHRPDDGEPVLRLLVADRVAAGEDCPGLARRLGRSREDVTEHGDRQLLREGGDREREQRSAAHREHVVEGVRRGDPAERSRVVDHGREEVHREDDRRLSRRAGRPRRRPPGRGRRGDRAPPWGRSPRAAPRAGRRSTSRRTRRPSRGSSGPRRCSCPRVYGRPHGRCERIGAVPSALVTGGSSGIGLAIARMLHERGLRAHARRTHGRAARGGRGRARRDRRRGGRPQRGRLRAPGRDPSRDARRARRPRQLGRRGDRGPDRRHADQAVRPPAVGQPPRRVPRDARGAAGAARGTRLRREPRVDRRHDPDARARRLRRREGGARLAEPVARPRGGGGGRSRHRALPGVRRHADDDVDGDRRPAT